MERLKDEMRLKPYLLLIILLGWGIFLLLQNYILTPPIFDNLFTWIRRLFLISILLLISIALGESILSNHYAMTLLERRIFETGLGFSILGFIVFFLGVLKLYYFFTGFILIGFLFLLLWPKIRGILIRTLMAIGYQKKENFTQSKRLVIIAIALSLLIILMGALIPPLDYDTLEYHLGVPAQYIKAHGIKYLPYNVFSNFPLHMEMLYTLGLLLDGPILSKMLHFLFLILTLFTVYILGNKILPRSGLISVLIFVNIPIVALTSAKAYNDLGLTFFGLLSIYSVWLWYEQKAEKSQPTQRLRHVVLAGLFCGSAIATKYTGIMFFLAPLAIFLFIISLKEKKGIQALSRPVIFVIIALLVASPWFIKNLVYTGNPVFPIAYRQFGGRNWGEFEAIRFKEHHQVALTALKNVMEAPKKIITGQEENTGITILLFIPFLFFIRNLPPRVKCLGIYATFYFLIWTFFTHHMPRFLMPALAVLSVLAGFSIFYFLRSKKLIGYAMLAFLSIAFIFNSARLFYQFSVLHPLQFICGKDSQTEYLSKIFYLHPAIDFINTSLPQDSRILFIAEARTFYCEKDFLANTPLDKNIIVEIANKSKAPRDIFNSLRDMKVTHILYNATEVKRISQFYNSFNWANPKAQGNYMDFIAKYLKAIFSQEGVIVAELSHGKK